MIGTVIEGSVGCSHSPLEGVINSLVGSCTESGVSIVYEGWPGVLEGDQEADHKW